MNRKNIQNAASFPTFVVVLVLTLFANMALADKKVEQAEGPSGVEFIKGGESGWYWYEVEEEPLEEEREETAEPLPEKPEEVVKEEERMPPSPSSGPPPLSVEWFQENLDTYRNLAIDTPSSANVRAYAYLQRIAMDKAERFATKYQEVVIGDPILDESNRYPTSGHAGKRLDSAAREETIKMLNDISKRAGIFFFFKKDCPLCGQQAWILEQFKRITQIEVVAISMDGAVLEDRSFKVHLNQGHDKIMGVVQAPAIVLAQPKTGKYKIIGQGGGYDIEELKLRLLVMARSIGVISPEEYEKTQPVKGGLMLTDASKIELDDQVLGDPEEMVEIVRSLTPIR